MGKFWRAVRNTFAGLGVTIAVAAAAVVGGHMAIGNQINNSSTATALYYGGPWAGAILQTVGFKLSHTLDITDFPVSGNGQMVRCGLDMTLGDNTKTVSFKTCAEFTPASVGEYINIQSAEGEFHSTIASYISSKSVTVADAIPFTVVDTDPTPPWTTIANDDASVINTALANAPNGATIRFDCSAAGGFYGIASSINLPLDRGIKLTGDCVPVSSSGHAGFVIGAMAPMTAMIYRAPGATQQTEQTVISHLTLDGGAVANYGINFAQIHICTVDHNRVKGVLQAAYVQGDVAQDDAEGCYYSYNNAFVDNGGSGLEKNPYFATEANDPQYGFWDMLGSSDNHFDHNYSVGARITNFKWDGAGLFVTNNHAAGPPGYFANYGYDYNAVLIYASNNSCDSSTIACAYIEASKDEVDGTHAQWAGGWNGTASAVLIASGMTYCGVHGTTYYQVSDVLAIVQQGTADPTCDVTGNSGATYTSRPGANLLVADGRLVGSHYPPRVNGSAAAAVGAAGTLYFLPFEVAHGSETLKSVSINITTGNASGFTWRGCVYADAAGSRKPDGNTLLADTGDVSVAANATGGSTPTTGFNSGSGVSLLPGWYWVAVMFSATGESVTSTTTGLGQLTQDLGATTIAGAIAGSTTSGLTASPGYGACPATAPTTTRALSAGPIPSLDF